MILTLLLACSLPDMPEEWELDRLRLLAIRAEPAEPQPGELVTFTSLAYVPDDAEWSSVWFACMDGDEEGCTLDPDLIDQLENAAELTQEETMALMAALREAGFVGAQPGMDLQWAVPDDALAGLTDPELLEGSSGSVTVTLATEEDTEIVIKRVPVSLATTPNHNPDLTPLEIDGNPVDPTSALVLDTNNEYDLHVALTEDPETYSYVTTAGDTESRTEEPAWRWYTSGGFLAENTDDAAISFDESSSPESSFAWTTPEEPGEYTIAAVVLDGRGGMGWQELRIEVR